MAVMAVMTARCRMVARTVSNRTDCTVTVVSSSAGGSRDSTLINNGLG